jgi:hypothetical protein
MDFTNLPMWVEARKAMIDYTWWKQIRTNKQKTNKQIGLLFALKFACVVLTGMMS